MFVMVIVVGNDYHSGIVIMLVIVIMIVIMISECNKW